MNELLIYLIKSAGLLSVFYLIYDGLLKQAPFFVRNRKFLLAGIFASAVFPAIYFTRYVSINIPTYLGQFGPSVETAKASSVGSFDWWLLTGIIYAGVSTVLLFRFFFRLFSVAKVILHGPKIKLENFKGMETSMKISPFSFFNVIVYNPKLHPKEELKLMLAHEKVHARQKHSLDILLVNLVVAVLWFNPLSWLYKKAVEQNLEFLADSEATKGAISKTVYQRVLLYATVRGSTPNLSTDFYQSSIKQRIIMLNKKSNSKRNSWKIAMIFPLLLAFMVLLFGCKTEPIKTNNEQAKKETSFSGKKANKPMIVVNGEIKADDFDINSISPDDIASVKVLKDSMATEKYGERAKNGVMEITLKKPGRWVVTIEPKASFDVSFENDGKSNETESGETNINKALFVVDGKVMKHDFDPKSIHPTEIKNVTILEGKVGTKKFGGKAINGAVEITLKEDRTE